MARKYSCQSANYVCGRLCIHVYFRRLNRDMVRKCNDRYSIARYLLRSSTLSYCNGYCCILWYVRRYLSLVPAYVWKDDERNNGLYPFRNYLHRCLLNILANALLRIG